MRNYWLRIALGAAAVFSVGMIGVTLARHGASRVRGVVEGSGPITLPLGFLPFKLNGEKLGTVHKVVVLRDAPKQISAVELEVKLQDSILARGLEGCQLAAHFDADPNSRGGGAPSRKFSPGMFTCLSGHVSQDFRVFGRATFQPGNVSVPLLLPNDIVDDLKEGNFGSSDQDSAAAAETAADSISQAAEALADSIAEAAEMRAESIVAESERLTDSLRREGLRRADSTRHATSGLADPDPAR